MRCSNYSRVETDVSVCRLFLNTNFNPLPWDNGSGVRPRTWNEESEPPLNAASSCANGSRLDWGSFRLKGQVWDLFKDGLRMLDDHS